jgi:hypothetical protein
MAKNLNNILLPLLFLAISLEIRSYLVFEVNILVCLHFATFMNNNCTLDSTCKMQLLKIEQNLS